MEGDALTAEGIKKYLTVEVRPDVRPSVEGSTNDIVKGKASVGEEEGYVLIAGTQSGGKGRVGRSFFSPPDTGIYLSLLLRPGGDHTQQTAGITTMAAVAACEAIEKIAPEKALIKWVNDIYVRNKKVSGILTEASFRPETMLPEYAVLGIGFNVYTPEKGFPEEIRNRAGAILSGFVPEGRNRLASEFLNRFMYYYTDREPGEYVEKYRARSFVIGQKITVIVAGTEQKATALAVDDECRLLVRYEDGRTETLSSGEVSIRI